MRPIESRVSEITFKLHRVIDNDYHEWNQWNQGCRNILIVFGIATNSLLLPSIRISIGLRQLRPAPALGRRAEPAPALGRMFTKPRAVWVGGGIFGEKILFVNFCLGQGYPGVFVSVDTTHIHISPHYIPLCFFKKNYAYQKNLHSKRCFSIQIHRTLTSKKTGGILISKLQILENQI